MPSAEDRLDPVVSDQVVSDTAHDDGDSTPPPPPAPAAAADQTLPQDILFENPFLKPAKQLKSKS